MNKKLNDPDVCEVPRWQLIKATLNNLSYTDFVNKASEDQNAQMIDVRTEEEHATESIPDSIVMNYLDRDLADQLEKLDSSKSYYVYCRTGRRSLRVCVILRNLGFKNVYNLEEGIVSRPQT